MKKKKNAKYLFRFVRRPIPSSSQTCMFGSRSFRCSVESFDFLSRFKRVTSISHSHVCVTYFIENVLILPSETWISGYISTLYTLHWKHQIRNTLPSFLMCRIKLDYVYDAWVWEWVWLFSFFISPLLRSLSHKIIFVFVIRLCCLLICNHFGWLFTSTHLRIHLLMVFFFFRRPCHNVTCA